MIGFGEIVVDRFRCVDDSQRLACFRGCREQRLRVGSRVVATDDDSRFDALLIQDPKRLRGRTRVHALARGAQRRTGCSGQPLQPIAAECREVD
ncbi:hypothetical protein HRbin27_00652 [bacterium HR27]|nr:hypothetical protein HRbin27_00652 [bacterium HR27]